MSTDINILRENGRKIENWIRENIAPYLDKGITLGFGGKTRRGHYNEIFEDKHELYVRPDYIGGATGGLSMLFDDEHSPSKENAWKVGKCGWIFLYSDNRTSRDFLETLTLEWMDIKMRLHTAVEQEKRRQYKLNNFEV